MGLGAEFESVLAAARTGAPWALSTLYRALHPPLLRYLRVHEPEHYEDIASEAWMGVASGLDRFRGGEHDLRKWLFSIARRRLIDHRRATRRDRERVATLARQRLPVGDSEDEALEELATEAALRAVAALPEEQCEVVLLRVLADLDVAEVASIMGKSKGAVRALQHRAVRALARQLSGTPVTPGRPRAMYPVR
jgi:RNA polymerase sigma-70 factor (ECF subfamily)